MSTNAKSGKPSVADGGEGLLMTDISTRMVALHKEFYGKGPTKAKTYYWNDLLVVLMRGGFTRVEETLRLAGRGTEVIEQRATFQEVMRERFKGMVEEVVHREVIGFMSASQQDPDMLAEIFVLAPTEPGPGSSSSPGASSPG